MAEEVRVWEVGAEDRLTEISRSKLNLEERIEKWIVQDVSVLWPDLLLIGEQVKTAFGKYIDLLCIDSSGNPVIVELKRDMTPRDVVAQALDYASWVKDLSVEEIEKIALEYFKGKSDLRRAFKEKFSDELPVVINEGHSMRVVASEIDDSTERIIRYLSETYGVDINAVRFQFYQAKDGRQFLLRTFAISPEEVETATNRAGRGKRTVATPQQMEDAASAKGVGELYRMLKQSLASYFRVGYTKTTCFFSGKVSDGSVKVICSLVPGDSSAENGLRFIVYSKRLAEFTGVDESTIEQHLALGWVEYEYYPNAPEDLTGWQVYIKNEQDISKFMDVLIEKPEIRATSGALVGENR